MGVKIIFLDIDGVLNYGGCPDRAPSNCIGIADEKLSLLKQIVDVTNAKIVLISTWKFGWEKIEKDKMLKDCVYMDQQFANHGLTIYDATYDRGWNRGYGIINYINMSEDYIDSWIVIDDEVFVDYEENGILPKLIKTSFYNDGLKEEHVIKAIKMLSV